MAQATMFDIQTPDYGEDATIQERFEKFHALNPHVYPRILEVARELKSAGLNRIGIGMIFERLRWLHAIATRGDDYKLNNTFRSRYARMVMESEPDLIDIFEVRKLRSD